MDCLLLTPKQPEQDERCSGCLLGWGFAKVSAYRNWRWIVRGAQPDYLAILEIAEIDDISGPWVLLDGFIEQTAADDRQVFTFLRGVLVKSENVGNRRVVYTFRFLLEDPFWDF